MTGDEISDAKDTINEFINDVTTSAPPDVVEAIKSLVNFAESAATEIASADNATEEAEEEVESLQADVDARDSEFAHLETRYPRLFTGDLSKLDWSERKDLFDALVNLTGNHLHSADSQRTLARIDGKL